MRFLRRKDASRWRGFLSMSGERKGEPTWGHLFTGTRDFIACNHLRSYKYYSDSIIYPDGFLGYPCASYDLFKEVSTSQSFGMDPIESIILKIPLIHFFFFSLSGWIMLLIDIFVSTRENVSHAQKRDAQLWVTMQTDSRTRLKMSSRNFTWILERPRIFLVSFECLHCYLLLIKIFFSCLTVNFGRWTDLITVQSLFCSSCFFFFCPITNASFGPYRTRKLLTNSGV